ncbi:GNAT family N-acetyltransferase [Bowmanella yangjiangensis]|uniref:GNAT family N-acetyltransferase n=1 Tax=Bowmanella yangjiangensis TaxID=2811230 RepID=UPI001E500E45|nr:GNAT family N-acetyltransferase [Bowmanella yangjiangensis]
MAFTVEEYAPNPQEYCHLRVAAGLSAKSLQAAQIGLPNSLYAVCMRDGQKLIAMGRVVGDGACNFEVVDIAVEPHYQGQELGKQVMAYIDQYLAGAVLPGSYVSMIADKSRVLSKARLPAGGSSQSGHE